MTHGTKEALSKGSKVRMAQVNLNLHLAAFMMMVTEPKKDALGVKTVKMLTISVLVLPAVRMLWNKICNSMMMLAADLMKLSTSIDWLIVLLVAASLSLYKMRQLPFIKPKLGRI